MSGRAAGHTNTVNVGGAARDGDWADRATMVAAGRAATRIAGAGQRAGVGHPARAVPAAEEQCLHEVFEAQAAKTPDATAIVCGDARWTYAELDRVTNSLARRLRALDAGPGQFVAIYFERSELPIIAILACHKSGAAYVPIDPAYPSERIQHIADELGLLLCLTETALADRAHRFFAGTRTLVLDAQWPQILACADSPIGRAESGVSPADLAYVIYTSGTTGRPKGVMAEHRQVTRFVDAFNAACGTTGDDRVYQGFSLSFDGSVEEIWMAFSNGSTLVVPTRDAPRFGSDLGDYLTEQAVTYFSTVPTMLATLTDVVPTLRTVVLSGEVCPPELVDRWARRGLRLLNVYGPTEATVNTTVAECRPGRPVTIGRPLRGYGIHILDDKLRPVPPGAKGELLISGPTLARGYINQPALTDERFLTTGQIDGADRFYRTGDLVRLTADGELEFFGRMDTQVKIRGYRVELSEIESVLRDDPQVRAAAVQLVERDGLQQLAAYVVAGQAAGQLGRDQILSLLESRMPPYMIPGYLDVVPELPRTTSGKIDRNQLPPPQHPLVRTSRTHVAPQTELEAQIAGVWGEILGIEPISVTDDFFLDLGGHSLLAARMATTLRQRISRTVTVRDAYECPTVRALAERLESLPAGDGADAPASAAAAPARGSRAVFHGTPRWERLATFALQALSIYVMAAMAAIPLGVTFLLGRGWFDGTISTGRLVVLTVAVVLLTWPVFLTVSIAVKWLIIGRYKPGEYPLWSLYYWRWWLCNRVQAFSGLGGLSGTPLQPLVFRLMGARVGARCTLDTAQGSAWDLLSIGSDTSIGADTQLLGYRVEDGMLRLGTVEIGDRCFIGIHSALGLGVRMGHDSRLDDQSLLPDGAAIPAGEGRRGSPPRPADVCVPAAAPRRSPVRRFLFGAAHLVAAELTSLLVAVPLLSVAVVLVVSFLVGGPLALALALVLSVPVGVVLSCLILALVRRIVLSRVRPGTYPVESMLYVRKWLSDGLMGLSRALLLPVYTTLYLPPWLRLMGAKIGHRAELSTVWNFAPELIDVGAESFFADGSIIGGRRAHLGMFQISVNRIGSRSFVGNSAVLPVGSSLGDGCLLGVQSVPPPEPARTPDRSEWLGSPSFALTHRPKVGNFEETVTFRPTVKLYFQRAMIDALRIVIPGYIGLAALVAWVFALNWTYIQLGPVPMVALAPVTGLVLGLGAIVVVAALKKAVMGTFKPEIKPLWSMYVWLNEMVNGAYESVVTPVLSTLLGTPFVAPFLRLMGCRIGRHTFIATALFSEWDLVEIGDYAALNHGVVIQNHLFEDRVFKSSHLTVGPEASVGNMSVVLYDSEIERGAVVGPLSLLMKGETLASGTRWHGIPTVQAAAEPAQQPGGTGGGQRQPAGDGTGQACARDGDLVSLDDDR
jgi:non-ribosomal peptide synthetase-like protein